MSRLFVPNYIDRTIRSIAGRYGKVLSVTADETEYNTYWLSINWTGALGGSYFRLPPLHTNTTIETWKWAVDFAIEVEFHRVCRSVNAQVESRRMSPNAAMEWRARNYNLPIICEDDSGNEKSYQSPEEWYAEVMAYLKKKKPDLAQVLWTVA